MYRRYLSGVIKHMKSIAVFLILNILLLSSFTDTTNSNQGKASCCVAKAHKDCCKQQKHSSDNDCAKGNCNAMLSCGTCGFVITASISISPIISTYNKDTAIYIPIKRHYAA